MLTEVSLLVYEVFQNDLVLSSFGKQTGFLDPAGEDGTPESDDEEPYFSYIYNLFIKFDLSRVGGYGLRKDWISGSSYNKQAIVEYGGMLWETPEDIDAGSDLSKAAPDSTFLNEVKINITFAAEASV